MKTFNNTKSFSAFIFFMFLTSTIYAADYPAPGDFQKGAKTWADNCGRCHNIRGAKELRDDQWISTVFHMRVRAGLTGQESRDVLTFLQGSNTTPTIKKQKTSKTINDELTVKTGEVIYNQTCVSCHGVDGRGNLPGVPDFQSAQSPLKKSDELLINNITNGFQSPGASMAMPAKGGNPELTPDDIVTVLKYLHKTFKQ